MKCIFEMGQDMNNHKTKRELTLGKDEVLEDETCIKCGGLLVTNYGQILVLLSVLIVITMNTTIIK